MFLHREVNINLRKGHKSENIYLFKNKKSLTSWELQNNLMLSPS